MYKLLLVDDESIVIDTMKNVIDWNKYGIVQVDTCLNAIEALRIIDRDKPDIIITDIKMPVMDGIGLIRQVKNRKLDVEFIILSGYNEFDFAKSAMQEGVKHYLLKPCNEEEVAIALKNTITDLEERRAIQNDFRAYQSVEKSLLSSYIMLALQNMDVHTDIENVINMLLGKQNSMHWISFHYNGENEKIKNVYECFSSMSENCCFLKLVTPVLKINATLGGIYISKEDDIPLTLMTRLQKKLSASLNMIPAINPTVKLSANDISCCISNICGEYTGYLCITEDHMKYERINSLNSQDSNMFMIMKSLETALYQPKTEFNIHDAVKQIFYTYDRNIAIIAFTRLLIKYLHNGIQSITELTQVFNKIYETSDIDELSAFIASVFEKINFCNPRQENFINIILDYIEEHLDDSNLSIKWCANNLVFLDENYVGKVFIKQSGESFNTYLNKKRMEHAKFLIGLLGEDKIYTVADKVGFGHDPRYFSKLFKKYTGYTPKEYKSIGK